MLGVQNCWENTNVGKSKLLGDQNSFKYTESIISRLRCVHWYNCKEWIILLGIFANAKNLQRDVIT